jgi:hypothetical protein
MYVAGGLQPDAADVVGKPKQVSITLNLSVSLKF